MDEKEGSVFTLNEANEMVAEIAKFTSEVVALLNSIRGRYEPAEDGGDVAVPEPVMRELEEALRAWSEKVTQTGALPKGYFTVDFATSDPEMVYCWTYGEHEIGYTHKVWENFTHRQPLADAGDPAHLRWVN
jgi:hypothetical protein